MSTIPPPPPPLDAPPMMNAPSFDEVPIGNTDPTWSSTKPTSKSAAKDFSTAPYLPSANKPRRGSLKLSSFGDIDNYKNFVQSSRPTSNPTPTPNSPGAARSVFKDHSNSPLTPNTAKTARQSNLTPRSLQPRKMSSPKPAFCPSGSGVAAKNAHRARGMSGSIADSTMTPTKGNTVVRKPMSSTKKRTPKKLYRWELDPEQRDESETEKKLRLAQKDNEHTPGVEGSFKPDPEHDGIYVKSDGAPNPSWVDFRIQLTAAEYEELLLRKRRSAQVKKHKKRFEKADKENSLEPSAVHSVLPYVEKSTIEASLYRR